MIRRTLPSPPPGQPRWTPAAVLAVAARVPEAMLRLLAARIQLARIDPAAIERRNRAIAQRAAAGAANRPMAADRRARALAMAGYLLPRVAHLVPWRSDCLVLAMAAQDWLARRAIGSAIVIGIDSTAGEGFVSHAWLESGNQIVTGGVIGRYTVVLGSAPSVPAGED